MGVLSLKVVLLAKYLPKDGATTHIYTLANGFKNKGHEVHILSAGPTSDQTARELFLNSLKGINHHNIGFPLYFNLRFYSKILQMFRYIFVIPRTLYLLAKIKPDVIHVHYPVTSYLASLYKKITKKKFVTTYHIKGIPNHLLHKKADCAIAISSELKKELEEEWGYDNDKIRLVFNGVSRSRFDRNISFSEKYAFKSKLGIDKEKITIGFVGTYQYKKGIDILLEACTKLRKYPTQYQVVLLGDGDIDWVKGLIEKYDLKGTVLLRGFQDPVDFYAAFDIFVLPSRNEGFPLVALEAMMMGVPTIRSNVSGANDMIKHGESGLIFQNGDSAELAKYLDKLIEDRNLRDKLGQNGKEYVLQNFTEEIMITKLLFVYEEISGAVR